MAAPKRTKDQRQKDLVTIAKMYLQGYSQWAIAKELGLSQNVIWRDLQEIRKCWKEKYTSTYEQLREEQLAKTALVEYEAWEAWHKSKTIKKKTVRKLQVLQPQEEVVPGVVTQPELGQTEEIITEEEPVGDPRFLEMVNRCIERRCRILGIEAPLKISPTDPTGRYPHGPVLRDIDRIRALESFIEYRKGKK